MALQLVNIGFGSLISAQHLVAAIGPDSAPVKRAIQEARERGALIDATYGHKTQCVLLMDSDHVILSALPPETVMERFSGDRSERSGAEREDTV